LTIGDIAGQGVLELRHIRDQPVNPVSAEIRLRVQAQQRSVSGRTLKRSVCKVVFFLSIFFDEQAASIR